MDFEVYCDESGLEALTRKDAHLFTGIGGIWIPAEHRITLKQGINAIKEKYSIKGELKWQKCLGGTADDLGLSIINCSKGGYLIAGTTASTDGDVTGNHGSYDVWIIKIDDSGNLKWQKCLGGTGGDFGECIRETKDGGYIVAASANSNNGDVTGAHGNDDLWMIKIDSAGAIQWEKCYGGTNADARTTLSLTGGLDQKIISVENCSDKGYIIATQSSSNDGDVSGHHGLTGTADVWVLKIDSVGTIQWQNSFGGSGADVAWALSVAPDKNYLVVGQTNSPNDGDVTSNHGNYDSWVLNIDTTGTLLWEKCFGGTGIERASAVSITNDGKYFISGFSGSHNGNVGGNHGNWDIWVMKLDAAANILWQKCLGGSAKEIGASQGFQITDGGYIVTGSTNSTDFDVTGNHGSGGINYDFWLVNLSDVPANVITGNVYDDLNGNCIRDTNEIGLSSRIVKAMPGNYFATTDANGNYALFVDQGNYTVSHFPAQYYDQSCPISGGTYNVSISALSPNSFGNAFADTLNTFCADLKISVGTSTFRRCFKNNFNVSYSNIGAVAADSVSITVTFDNLIIPLSSSIPWTKVGNNYIFTIGLVQPGNGGSFTITDSVDCGAVIGLQSECALATITSITPECVLANNSAHDCHYIVGSCDPNGKEVASQNSITNGYVKQEDINATDTLTYIIHFQNTGNDTAFTVVVRDTLSSYLDAASVETLAASHTYTFRIYGHGICEWTFNNILLTDTITNELESHGFVKFKVNQTSGNPLGTEIKNDAAIWFDYNFPVKTNTTLNTIPLITGVENISASAFSNVFFPNPFINEATLKISTADKIKNATLKLYDLFGHETRIISGINSNEIKIERENLQSGIYFYRLVCGTNITFIGKFIIE